MSIYLRRAERADIPQMIPLFNDLDRIHRENYPYIFRPLPRNTRSSKMVVELMADASNELWLAVDCGVVHGLAVFMHRETVAHPQVKHRDFLVLDQLIVQEQNQGKGIGKLFLEKAKEVAEKRNYSHVSLKVYELNEDVMDWYERSGYETTFRTMEMKLK